MPPDTRRLATPDDQGRPAPSARQDADRLTGHGELHYPGDVVGDTVGRVMGPTTLGQWLICYHAEYDATADRTVAHMRPATPADLGGAA